MPRLVAHTGHEIDLPEKPVSFGTDPSNDVVVPDIFGLAANHFVIWPRGEGFLLRDSGSGKGCWVNGKPVYEAELNHGDLISAGKLNVTYQAPEAAPRENPAKTPVKAEANNADAGPSTEQHTFLDPVPPRRSEAEPKVHDVAAKFELVKESRATDSLGTQPSSNGSAGIQSPNAAFWEAPRTNSMPKSQSPDVVAPAAKKRWKSGHQTQTTAFSARRAVQGIAILILLGGILTVKNWGHRIAIQMENVYTTIFVPPTAEEGAKAKQVELEQTEATVVEEMAQESETQRRFAEDVIVDMTKAHRDVLAKFIYPEATTLYSLGFPEVEIFYINHAQQRGLPLPQEHSAFLERHFQLRASKLERLTSIQTDPEHLGLVVVTTKSKFDPCASLKKQGIIVESGENFGSLQVFRFVGERAEEKAVLRVDDRNFVIGEPGLILACLHRKKGTLDPIRSALLPEFLDKEPGCFLWTVLCDDALQAQLAQQSKKPKEELQSVRSFAMRYSTDPDMGAECFALKSEKAGAEVFALGATTCLHSMVQMLNNQALASTAYANSQPARLPRVTISKTAANLAMPNGEQFVSLFLENFYVSAVPREDPIKPMLKARQAAHTFNLALEHRVRDAQFVRTPQEALALLNKGMSSRTVNNMEFHMPMPPPEMESLAAFLTFADGYLACRPMLEQMPSAVRETVQEGRDRMYAETLLSIISAPSTTKVIKLADPGAYVAAKFDELLFRKGKGAKGGPPAVFGLPRMTKEELSGALRFISQDARGQLVLRPGELSLAQWNNKRQPVSQNEVQTILSIASAATAAGADRISMAKTVDEAIQILAEGVKGSGKYAATEFRYRPLSVEAKNAAAALLTLEEGYLRPKDAEIK